MKLKYALIALLAISFYGCDDNTANLGLGMFPGSDQNIKGKLTTFDVTTESVPTGRIYAKTNIGYVGKFTDKTFGTYEAGFLSELYCPDGTTFPKTYTIEERDSENKPVKASGTLVTDLKNAGMDDKMKERYPIIREKSTDDPIGNCQISIHLWYSKYFGDSLTACRLSVYELEKPLEEKTAYYTDINPDDYYDKEGLLGTKAYTAVDLSVSDSIRNLDTYMPSVSIQLDEANTNTMQLARKFIESNGNNLAPLFSDILKGIYVKNDYGDGTVLYISEVQLDLRFVEYVTDSITGLPLKSQAYAGKDSIKYNGRSFYSTREVIQSNRLFNDKEAIQKCIDNPDLTYLKSPAGIFTQATLPVKEIATKLEGDTLNAVRLSFPIYNETASNKKFGMSAPKSVLLVRKKYKDEFFKKNWLSDGTISSLFDRSTYTTAPTEYTFNNITKLINNCLEDRAAAEREIHEKKFITVEVNNEDGTSQEVKVDRIEDWEELTEWNKVVLIPVLVTTDSGSNGLGNLGYTSNVIGIQHDLKPGYARLKGGKANRPENLLKLEVVSTNFGSNETK